MSSKNRKDYAHKGKDDAQKGKNAYVPYSVGKKNRNAYYNAYDQNKKK